MVLIVGQYYEWAPIFACSARGADALSSCPEPISNGGCGASFRRPAGVSRRRSRRLLALIRQTPYHTLARITFLPRRILLGPLGHREGALLRAYEVVLVLTPTLDEDAIIAFLARARQALELKGAEVSAVERWGKRRLAYDIRDFKEASYILMRFRAPAIGGTAELEHLCRISEDVLRHLIVLEQEGASIPVKAEGKNDGDEASAVVAVKSHEASVVDAAPAEDKAPALQGA